jgi:RND family efflux transporter MFP subunit
MPAMVMVAGMTFVIIGCGPRNEFISPPPPEVTVALPLERDLAETMEFTGTTRATASVELRARVNGYLERIAFEDGAIVKEGDLLFVIQQAPFKADRDAAEAQLQKAKAELQLADANLARSEKLFEQKAITEQQFDIQKAERAKAAAEVASAEAALKQAQLNLGFTEVKAPFAGKMGRHLVDRGNIVQAEQTILAKIETIDPIYAYFYVSERDLLQFMELRRAGVIPDPEVEPPTLRLGLANEPDFPHIGKLDYLEWGVDPGTGTLLRRGTFPNTGYSMISGMFVRIRAELGKPQKRLLVEERAIGTDQRGDYVLVVNDQNIVEHRPVKLGMASGGMRVIDEGIGSNDWVIVNGLQRARPAAPVTPKRQEMQTAAAPAKTANGEAQAPVDEAKGEPKAQLSDKAG